MIDAEYNWIQHLMLENLTKVRPLSKDRCTMHYRAPPGSLYVPPRSILARGPQAKKCIMLSETRGCPMPPINITVDPRKQCKTSCTIVPVPVYAVRLIKMISLRCYNCLRHSISSIQSELAIIMHLTAYLDMDLVEPFTQNKNFLPSRLKFSQNALPILQ